MTPTVAKAASIDGLTSPLIKNGGKPALGSKPAQARGQRSELTPAHHLPPKRITSGEDLLQSIVPNLQKRTNEGEGKMAQQAASKMN